MKDKQCLLSFKAIRVENPSTLINFVFLWRIPGRIDFFFLIHSSLLDYELFFLCTIAAKEDFLI